MKRSQSTTIAVALASLLTLFSASAMRAEHGCSYRGVAGDWGFRIAGSFLTDPSNTPNYPSDVPFVGVGTFTLDRNGNVTGTGVVNSGAIGNLTFSGTYTVDASCAGTMTLDIVQNGQEQGTFTYSLVFVDRGRELHVVSTEPEFVINLDAKKVSGD
jgi:hypothetical protein